MRTTIYNQDERILPWAAEKLGEDNFDGATGIGLEKDSELIAAVVFNMYTKASICMHVASDGSKNWLNKDFLFRAFAYPFIQLKCNRITGLVRVDNIDAQIFDEKLGFKKEGLVRKGSDDGTDMILYGMLKEECRWIGIKI
jgi:RimJ/RimL family protein N-acetyltransferase